MDSAIGQAFYATLILLCVPSSHVAYTHLYRHVLTYTLTLNVQPSHHQFITRHPYIPCTYHIIRTTTTTTTTTIKTPFA